MINLKQFIFDKKNPQSTLFNLAIGEDGAPATGCTFLVSFINVGQRIASSSENFLLFGGNVDESSLPVRNFIKKMVIDLRYLESQVFEVLVDNIPHKIEFTLSELPNDMKMLCFLAGELSAQQPTSVPLEMLHKRTQMM